MAQFNDRERQRLEAQAILFAQNGDWQRACATNQTIIKRFPPVAGDYNRLGAALAKLGRICEAVNAYRNAIAHSPDNTVAQKNLRMMESQLEKDRILGGKGPVVNNNSEFGGHLTYLARLEAAARVLWRSDVAAGIRTGVTLVLCSRKAGEWSRTHDTEPQDAQLSWRSDAQGEREGFERNPTGAGINGRARSHNVRSLLGNSC